MPADVVDRGRAIVHAVGDGCDLVIGSAFREFFESTVDVSDRGLRGDDDLTIHLQYILKNTMGSRVCWAQVQVCVLLLFRLRYDIYVLHVLPSKHGVVFILACLILQRVFLTHREDDHLIYIEDSF